MLRKMVLGMVVAVLSAPAMGVTTSFSYTQSDSTTGSGTIAGFTYDPGDGGGPITFGPTALPVATVVNPNPGLTPGGFVGAINSQAGIGNESNAAIGLTFSGSVTATGSRGGTNYTMTIPLVFAPKVTQAPDVSDYNWNVTYGDSSSAGVDAVSTSMRFAMWLSRDTTIDAADTANTYQRYTQDNKTFLTGQDNFNNTNTTTTAIKDAMDSGDPQGTDAVGRNLAFYFGWRDQGALSSGQVLVDDFTIGGLLNPDASTLTPPVPEPSALGVVAVVAMAGWRRGRRA